ncbi:MAG TPA: STAS domain-containing protein [Acidimicrobiales bacterium]|jgi:anti-sigma B factor antagonist|nr:STAS domain-containing protein [Acidimicrobiales bacterium]
MDTSGKRDGLLRVATTITDGRAVVMEFSGELDLSTVPVFRDALDEVLRDGVASVELDLSRLEFIDSSGVGAYVTVHRRARASGARLSVGARSPLVDRVLQLSGVEAALAVESS